MRRKLVVVLSGPVAGGKSTLGKTLVKRFDGHRFSTRELLIRRLQHGEAATRERLQAIGEELDGTTEGRWVAEGFARAVFDVADGLVLIDAARRVEQIEAIRKAFGREVRHLHVTASRDVCAERYSSRLEASGEASAPSYDAVQADPTEAQVDTLARVADVVIDTERASKEDVFTRAAARLGLFDVEHGPCVDVLIGGLYGSEGKGNIAFYLAPEYDLLVRVGGPNAAHTVYLSNEEKCIHYSLPSGTRAGQEESRLLLGAGATVYLPELLEEISRSEVDHERLSIDPQVMIIEDSDKTDEANLRKRIGSTASGTGYANARRVMRHPELRLARDIPVLAPYIRPGIEVLEQAYRTRQRVFLEGTQGSGLSLFHGPHPWVTSRDTNVAGCLAEAGIAPARVRRVILVVRSYPIRVAGPSGRLRNEIDWQVVEERAGLVGENLAEKERTSKTKTIRRVGEFEWDLLRRAAVLNAPTDIALTFADYIDGRNREAWRYAQLTDETLQFIDELEGVTGARVSLVATGFMPRRGVIDRRVW